LKEVFSLLLSDDLGKIDCALQLLRAFDLLTPLFLGSTLKCLQDASLEAGGLLTAVLRLLASEHDVQKDVAAEVIARTNLPLQQWRLMNEQNGLPSLVGGLRGPGVGPGKTVKNSISLIRNACLDSKVCEFLIPRLAEHGLVDALLGLLDQDWLFADRESDALLVVLTELLLEVQQHVDISRELVENSARIEKAQQRTNGEKGRIKLSGLESIRPLSDLEKARLKCGRIVRLRDMTDPALRCFNNRFADIQEKQRDGKFKVLVRETEKVRRDACVETRGDEKGPPVLVLPFENLVGNCLCPHIPETKERAEWVQKHLAWIRGATCSNPECSESPSVTRVDDDWLKNLKKCKKCLNAQYCSTDCQKAHWKAHKLECALLHAWKESSFSDSVQS